MAPVVEDLFALCKTDCNRMPLLLFLLSFFIFALIQFFQMDVRIDINDNELEG